MTQATDTEIRDLILALDKKLGDKIDPIAADVVEMKIAQARTEERLNSLETGISDIKTELKDIRSEVRGQDARLWGFVVALFLALAGVLTKVVFFPQM